MISEFIDQISIIPIFDAIHEYGKQKARLRRAGNLIGDFDILIGTTATSNNLIMVTENVKDFERIENIKIENWVQRTKK